MSALSVAIRFIDGGLHEFEAGPDLLQQLHALQAQGLTGKQLIHELFTDDWGPPPVFIDIKGSAPDGSAVDVRIPY